MTARPRSLAALLADPAAPDRPLYTFLDLHGEPAARLGARGLSRAARALGATLSAALSEALSDGQSAVQGAAVLLVTGPGVEQPVGLFACAVSGAVAVPLYPPTDEAGRAALLRVAEDADARLLLAPRALAEPLLPLLRADGRPLRWVELRVEPEAETPGDARPLPDDPEATAVLLYTSGSTGSPKGAVLRHGALTHNLAALARCCGRGPADVVCTWLPWAHVAGLYTRLLPVFLGAEGVILSPQAFLQRPPLWLEVLSRARATVTAAPDFAYALVTKLLTDDAIAALDLSALDMAVSGGEVVRPATVDAFFGRLAPAGLRPAALHPYYGLTETLCTSIPQGRPPARLCVSRAGLASGRLQAPLDTADTRWLISNGPPLGPDTRVIAVDPERRVALPPGRVGELWTQGPGVIRRYTGPAEDSRARCAATLEGAEGEWFRTGDLGVVERGAAGEVGEVGEVGELYVTGRLKELIIVRGKNHDPVDVEATLRVACDEHGLVEVAAFAVLQEGEEALGLAMERRATEPPAEDGEAGARALRRAARRAVSERHGLAIAALYLLPPGAIPRTPTQKLARAACAALAHAGTWGERADLGRGSAPAAGPAPSLVGLEGPLLVDAIAAVLLQRLGAGPEALERPPLELGLSSLDLATLITALRGLLGVEPPLRAFFDGSSLGAVAVALAEAMRGAGRARQVELDAVPGWREAVRDLTRALPHQRPPERATEGPLLFTGATGFLGAHTLAALLRRGGEVRCLVRAADAVEAEGRLLRALAHGPLPGLDGQADAAATGGLNDRLQALGLPGRVVALPGDLRAPGLGLSSAEWARQGEELGGLLHNAADVNFVAPYSALAPVNVGPIPLLVSLALSGGAARPLHFVSTTAVFNTRNRREQRLVLATDRVLEPEFLYSGYARTKWVAESLLRVAGHCAIPLVIHRPGLIVGARETGVGHLDDFLSRFLLGCAALGRWPDAEIELDLVAVDDVAEGIAASIGRPIETIDYYHWTTARPTRLSELMAALEAEGARLSPEALPRWLDRLRAGLPLDNPLFPVHTFLLERPSGATETLLELFDGLPLRVAPGLAEPCPPPELGVLARWLLHAFHPLLPVE